MIRREKILAMMLVFTMTFSYFSIVTEALATTNFISLFGSSNKENENVEFEAFLADENNISNALVSDVNNEKLNIKLQLGVKNSGYLKDAKVEIKAEDDEKLNFVIKEENDVVESSKEIQSLEDNVLEFNKINYSSDEMEISIPIEYKNEEYINEDKLANTAKVILSGIYVDDEGKENEILKEIELTLAWKDDRTVKVESEVTKYIPFGTEGVILQTSVKVDNSNPDKNTLPVKETELAIKVPTINNIAPTEITLVANSTVGTNGKGVGETEFNENNWEYNSDENKLLIKVENNKELVKVNESDSYLKVEEDEIEEERYYSNGGVDEFFITYTYRNVEFEEELKAESKVDVTAYIFSGEKSADNQTKTSAEKSEEYILTGQTGNIVSYNIENETKEVSKAYGYLNKEIEYNSKTAINISNKDIVQEIYVEDAENYYTDKTGNKIDTEDIYYKEISVSKDNFEEILGENGTIEIQDVSGNVLTTINKETKANEDGNYVVSFQDKISKLVIKTSAPIAEGNLVISSKKAISEISLAKSDYANVESIATTTMQKAKFDYVSDLVDLGNCTVKTKLEDTVTDINLVVDRDNLSTVKQNSNVEIKIELNNDKENSDIFGESVFEVEMPEYITALNVTNASMIYGEGLDISNVESMINENGRVIIRITVSGKQTDFNSGVLTNGANIVLNADITIDKFTPSIETSIKANVVNSEATNYNNENNEVKINYSAPNGLVAINTVSNYNNLGESLTSVKEGTQIDYIDIYTEAKTANMEIVVINNNDNTISDLSILGRIPFKGVKDIATGKDLGTTIDTKLVSAITSNEANNGEFTIYYSENKEATKDLSDSSNKWVTNPESFENIKSYLIVPNDISYAMESKQTLKFNYNYEIPADLSNNQNIYGTFLAYYTNNSELATIDETSKPDLVGLTTGEGPELDLSVKTDKTEVKALDNIEVTMKIENAGNDTVSNIIANIPVPENTTYISSEISRDTATVSYEDGKVIANIPQLSKESSIEVTVKLKVNNISEYESDEIEMVASVTAKDLPKELTKKTEKIKIQRSEITIDQHISNEEEFSYHYQKGESIPILIYVKNIANNDINNLKVVTTLPKELDVVDAFISENGENIGDAKYDSSSNTLTWVVDKISTNERKAFRLNLKVGDLQSGNLGNEIKVATEVTGNNIEKYNAEDIVLNVGKSSIKVVQTTSTPTYVTEGDYINYTFEITNEGSSIANNIVLKDFIPEGVIVKQFSYQENGNESVMKVSKKDIAELTLSIPANTKIDVNVLAVADDLDGAQEKTVTNEGTISGNSIDEVKSNSVTHIIKSVEKEDEDDDNSSNNNNEDNNDDYNSNDNTNTNTDITKSYKITGTAWLDVNSNGMRDNDEKKMENVTAMLVDSNSGIIKSTVTTNNNGEYTFAGLQNGSYLVLFKYNTKLYTTTTYRKEGIESSVNSDAVTTKIEQDGRRENAAVTDIINVNGLNVSNVDIGFVESAQFSLKLDKAITKVTVQNSQGTVTEEFDKTKLAKYDIAAKYLSGTNVYVEYTFTITNNGDLAGYATEIVDYIPQGMTFNSNLNKDWYTGIDGNLYTKALADIELAKGESRDITLVLTKQMTAENTGLVSNTAEISDDYNIYGVSDINSTPANRAQGEDDIATADTILTVKTGESLVYMSGIIISAILGCGVAFVVYEKVLKNKRKGGV